MIPTFAHIPPINLNILGVYTYDEPPPRHAPERLSESIFVLSSRSLNRKVCSSRSLRARYKLEVARRGRGEGDGHRPAHEGTPAARGLAIYSTPSSLFSIAASAMSSSSSSATPLSSSSWASSRARRRSGSRSYLVTMAAPMRWERSISYHRQAALSASLGGLPATSFPPRLRRGRASR